MHSNTRKAPKPRPWIAIGLVVSLTIIALNMVAYLLYRYYSEPDTNLITRAPKRTSIQELALNQREEGARSLQAGQYSRAIRRFKAALELDPNVEDIKQLLGVAERLLKLEQAEQSEPSFSSSNKSDVPSNSATLLINTEPGGLLIEIDGSPVNISPARILLEPGPHKVKIKKGYKTVYRRTFKAEAGKTIAINRGFRVEDLTAAELSPPPKSRSVRPSTSSPSAEYTLHILMYWPSRTSKYVEESLLSEATGMEARAVSSEYDFELALKENPLAVIAPLDILAKHGLTPNLSSQAHVTEPYVVVTLKPLPKERIANLTLGVVDELGKHRMTIFIARILDAPGIPRVRRVEKTEDLLSLLQFSIARAILVRETELDKLLKLTQQQLHTITIEPSFVSLGLSYAKQTGEPIRASLKKALENLSANTKKALGVQAWHRRQIQ